MKQVILSLFVALSLSCASVSNLGMDPSIPRTVTMQRQVYDCVVAALAMTLDKTYEEIEATRQQLGIEFVGGGLSQRDALMIAEWLGQPLKVIKSNQVNLLKAKGMLVTGQADGQPFHAVYIEQGFIFDPQYQMAQPWVLWFEPRDETFVAYLLEKK